MSKYEMANELSGLGRAELYPDEYIEGFRKDLPNPNLAAKDFNNIFNKEEVMENTNTLRGNTQEYTKDQVIGAINMLSDICHSASVRGSWWHDLETGERKERNKLEMLMLIVSEVSEACEGVRKGVNDDHLPEYPMEDVEVADTLVRCFDYIGGWKLRTAEAFFDKILYNANRADHKVENRLKAGGKKA